MASRGTEPSFPEFVWIWNSLNGLTTPAHHARIARWLGAAWAKGDTRLLLMCFRGAGKSTVVGLFCAWLLATRPTLRLMVLSAEHALATKMVRSVRQIIRRHPLCRQLAPKGGGPGGAEWAADRFTVRRPGAARDPSMLARGIGANITGSRAEMVIADDVEVPSNCDTPGKREELRSRLAEIEFILVPGGTTLFIGTPHTPDTIYAEVAPKGAAAPFLAGYRRLMIPLVDEEGLSAWPERFTEEKVAGMRRRVGPRKFAAQMQLQPQPPEGARLDPSDLVQYDHELDWRVGNGGVRLLLADTPLVSGVGFWDPAFGQAGASGGAKAADASVLAAVFSDEAGRQYLHRIEYLTHDPHTPEDPATQLCRKVARMAEALHLPSVIVENNGIGRFLPGLLRQLMNRERVACAVLERASTRSKSDRILGALEPLLAARRLWVHRSVFTTPLIAEMREWKPGGAKGTHDDGLDAVAGALLAEPIRLPRAAPPPRQEWRGSGESFSASQGFTP